MKVSTLSVVLLTLAPLAHAQYTEIPDPNFEQELINDGIDSQGILDGRILTADAATTETLLVTGTFKPAVSKITDLTGIEDFSVLRVLTADGNLLTDVDLASNLELEQLQIQLNNLTALDLSTNTQLVLLYANNNSLTSLDSLPSLTQLLLLRVQSNQITTLDATNLTGLTELRAQSNYLQLNLDLSQNPSLTSMSVTTNPDLLCIQVADAASANAGAGIYASWTKDATALYSENCEAVFPTTAIPDDRFEDALIALGHDTARDNRVLTANISGLTSLDVSGESIADLTGIQDFAALSSLVASSNNVTVANLSQNLNLSSVDLSSNSLVSVNVNGLTGLASLDLSSNGLTSIDVSQNPGLTSLDLASNGLTTINLSSNTSLTALDVASNNLTALDVTGLTGLTTLLVNGNDLGQILDVSTLPLLTTFNATSNPSLACIEVADAAAADAGAGIYAAWLKDTGAVYSEDCQAILLEADLSITNTDGVTAATPGQSVTYTIVASNAGPDGVSDVSVSDTFPSDLTCSWTSVVSGGATGNTDGAGDLADTLDMPSGSSVTYTAACDIDSAATGTLVNTATISSAVTDPVPGNNSATDDDTQLVPASARIFEDTFELGNLEVWSDRFPPALVLASYPAEADTGQLTFSIDPTQTGDAVVLGVSGSGETVWQLEMGRRGTGELVAVMAAVADDGRWNATVPVLVVGDRLDLRVEWRRAWIDGARDGEMHLMVNGAEVAWLTGLDNRGRTVERVVATGHLAGIARK